jgi:2-keto-4-pentenoate hydratase/2-oxohepta-3-ene-1,7-dioic acid hydratase in catechol pathway
VFRTPQVFLKPGDRVALEIDGIGRLENPVIAAGEALATHHDSRSR